MDGIQGWRALCLSAGSELSQRTNQRFGIRLIQWPTNLALISNQLTQQGSRTSEIVRIALTQTWNSRWESCITISYLHSQKKLHFTVVVFWVILSAIKPTLFKCLSCSSASLCLTLSNKLGIYLNYSNGPRAEVGQGKS